MLVDDVFCGMDGIEGPGSALSVAVLVEEEVVGTDDEVVLLGSSSSILVHY